VLALKLSALLHGRPVSPTK